MRAIIAVLWSIFSLFAILCAKSVFADSTNYQVATTGEGQTIKINSQTGESWLWVSEKDPAVIQWMDATMNNRSLTLDYKRLLLSTQPKPLLKSGHWERINER